MKADNQDASGRSRAAQCGGCCTRLVDFGVTLNQTVVLEKINLHVHCGELTGIIGPNGAGKTTLFRAMLGEISHTGKLRFVHAGDGARFVAPRIGYVPQKLDLDAGCPVSVMDLFAGATTVLPVWLGHTKAKRREALERLAVVEAEQVQWEVIQLQILLVVQEG